MEVSNWDKGLVQNGDGSLKFHSTYVHLVRLVAAGAADGTGGSQIVPIWFDGATFRVAARVEGALQGLHHLRHGQDDSLARRPADVGRCRRPPRRPAPSVWTS